MAGRFALFTPSAYGYRPSGSGTTGVRPDLALLGLHRLLYRSRLPDLRRIVYTFPADEMRQPVQNFYHMGEFMMVGRDMMEMLYRQFHHVLEVAPVRIQYEDGSPPPQPYFAVRVGAVIDCINPVRSTWQHFSRDDAERTFADDLFTCVLDERCRDEFSNGGGGKYITYPALGDLGRVRKVELLQHKIPPGAVLFQPMYWPGHWLIEVGFADRLQRACIGGYADYFWTLDLDDVQASYDYYRRIYR